MTRPPGQNREGLTLTEILVILAAVSVLVVTLLPTFYAVGRRARTVACRANLRCWSVAARVYANENHGRLVNDGNDFGGRPDLNQRLTSDGKPRWPSYWFNCLPPMLGLTPYYQLAQRGEIPFPGNGIEPQYLCPSDTTAPGDNDGASGPNAVAPYRTANNLPYYFSIMYNNNSTGNGNEPPVLNRVWHPETSVLLSERRCNVGPAELPEPEEVLSAVPDARYDAAVRRGYTFQTLNVYRGAWSRVSARHDVGSNAVFIDGSSRWVPFGQFQLADPETGRYTDPRLIWNVSME